MIGRLSGVLLEKTPPQVTLEVQGVGYELDVPMSTFYNLPALGERVTLYTHLVVREDAHLLFGFGSEAERRVFRQLLKISGVGARTALSLLSGMSVADLAQAVVAQEPGRLTKVPGIGKKTAERIVLELRDRCDDLRSPARAAFPPGAGASREDAISALVNLGYRRTEAAAAVDRALAGGSADVPGLLRRALVALAR